MHDLQRLQPVQHVQLGQRQALDPADLHRLAHQRRIEPAAAPRPPRDRAEFMAALAQQPPGLVVQLGRERPAPTRVQYALAIPSTKPTADGPTPAPLAAVAATVLLLVTNG